MLDAEILADNQARTADRELQAAERQAALRKAFLDLPPCGQRLIALMLKGPAPYPTRRSASGRGFPSGASGLTAAATWTSCAATGRSPP